VAYGERLDLQVLLLVPINLALLELDHATAMTQHAIEDPSVERGSTRVEAALPVPPDEALLDQLLELLRIRVGTGA